jgi:hypothetical protein
MQTDLTQLREYFPRNRIASNRCKARVPEPLHDAHCGFDTRMQRRLLSGIVSLLLVRKRVPLCDGAAADEEDVTNTRCDIMPGAQSLQCLEGDSVGRKAVVLDPLCVGVFFVVKEDTTTW